MLHHQINIYGIYFDKIMNMHKKHNLCLKLRYLKILPSLTNFRKCLGVQTSLEQRQVVNV